MSTINVQVILQQEIHKGTPHIQMYIETLKNTPSIPFQ
jgi:hypothetical protein